MYLFSHSDLLTAPLYYRKMSNTRRQHPRPILCLCGAFSAPFLCGDPARYPRSNRAEYLLIYRIPSHTNPKRRDFSLKQPGQKSAKEEGPEQRKGPKRAVNGSLKVQTHIWEQDAGCSSHLTPTTVAGPRATCAPGPPFIKIFSGQSSPFLMEDFILKNTNGYVLRALCFLCWRHRRKTGKKRSCHNFRYCALYKNIEKY